jgi:hypothetical protein
VLEILKLSWTRNAESLFIELCNFVQSRGISVMTNCHLGVVVVSVLATGPKNRGFKPGRGDGFIRAIKIRSTPSSRMENKGGGPMS